MLVSSITPIDHPPMRSVYCLKNRNCIEEVEKFEDCFIIECDSYEFCDCLSLNKNIDQDDGCAPSIAVVAERGKVACRDYPHPRYLCVHPINKTDPETCYKLGYCHICDVPAPFKEWTKDAFGKVTMHCDATEYAYATLGYTYPSECESD